MNRAAGFSLLALSLTAGVVAWTNPDLIGLETAQAPMASGYVFHDANKNGKRDPGERGISGVKVSNQSLIVRTDRNGRWEMPAEPDEDTVYYVTKPRGYMTPVNENQIPQFYYVHKPKGSPSSRFAGVAPTGPLPASIDFPLYPRREPNTFEALFFGDTQPRDVREVDYIRHDIVEPIIGKHKADFGVTLGDVVFDDLTVFDPLIKTVALLGIPWYNVLGNHDINYEAKHDEQSDETWERYFGPNYYSFDHGPVHFVVLDNVEWIMEGERGRYRGGLGQKQLGWLAKDLSLVPANQLVVFLMHIPIVETVDREAFFRLIEERPYALSVSAHTHYQEHHFLTEKNGWKGKKPHHHVVNVTTCGSWWQGAPDENGTPHATMRDGAPNGYSIFKFDGAQYSIEFRAARRLESYQMDIHAPEIVATDELTKTEVLVNVFGGSERSKVEMRVGQGPWVELVKVLRKDPVFAEMAEREKGLQRPYRPPPAAIDSPHMWAGKLPGGLAAGKMHPIHVRTTDMFGQVYYATKGVQVR